MAETDLHRDLMILVIEMLRLWYGGNPMVYISGNLLLYYEPGNKRKHVSPDAFVVKGVPNHEREYYLLWVEGVSPHVAIEITSKSTKREDLQTKFQLYRDVLKVKEYFLFDLRGEYLDPPLQGYRLSRGRYVPIKPVAGRLPSKELGLHLEQDGRMLRFYDPATRKWVPTPSELRQQAEAARQQAEAARQQAEAAQQRAETARQQAEADATQERAARQQAEADAVQERAARQQAEAEVERLRRELEDLRQGRP
jgi:Uma2 family endonuclease